MILAWLLLLTGLTISAVAIYYSVIGLTAIFSAAVIPIIIMGSALEVGKLVCASWLKANWERAPGFIRYYMILSVVVLMFITSMGIFGFLSKAHNDQNLVSGDVQSKIAIYDEQIKTEKENIEANRKQLRQMDDAVDQVLGRSTDERGANNANNIRQRQLKDRQRIATEITTAQKKIATLNDQRVPIAAEVRKVEAEVGPIKYIAKFIYGERGADENMLEKAVTWIIILIVIVFDPLAITMLLAAQMSFGWRKEENNSKLIMDSDGNITGLIPTAYGVNGTPVTVPEETRIKLEPIPPDDGPLTDEQLKQIAEAVKTVKPDLAEKISKLIENTHTDEVPNTTPSTALGGDITATGENQAVENIPLDQWNKMIDEAEATARAEIEARKYHPIEDDLAIGNLFPENPITGQIFTRTDYDPTREFIYNGNQWVDLDSYFAERIKPDLTEVIETADLKKRPT